MEFQRQRDTLSAIEKIGINFKKDSSSRKTTAYIQIRLNALESHWTDFHNNHEHILEQEDRSHDYFKQDMYIKAKHLYESIKVQLLTFKLTAKDETPTMEPTNEESAGGSQQGPSTHDTSTNSKSDEMKSLQRTNFRALQRVVRGIDMERLTEKWELEDKLQMLLSRWKVIDELHWKIDNILVGTDEYYELEFAKHEETYELIKKQLNKKLNSTAHQHLSTPQVDIPTFSGNYSQWPTFMDLYSGAIHNNPVLTKAQKMQHLKGKLKGEAERLVQHLNVSTDNYDTCWELLTHRYNNLQLLFTKQIQIFMEQQAVYKQTSSDLKRLHDITMETIHAIHNLGVDTTSWDPLLVHIISGKLDSVTYSDYMEARKAPRELPLFEELMTFIESKFTALETVNKNNNSKNINIPAPRPPQHTTRNTWSPQVSGKFHHRTYFAISDRKCPICKTYNHILFNCKEFNNMTPDNKLKTLTQLDICKNCLYCHNGKTCNSTKRCKVCNLQHNTLLHEIVSEAPTKPTTSNWKMTPNQKKVNHIHGSGGFEEILLATTILNVKCSNGTFIQLRALLDQGSQISLISENAVQRLGIKRCQQKATISGVGLASNYSKGAVHLTCESLNKDYTFTTEALIMNKVLNNLPNTTFEKRPWDHLQNIQLADPDYNISRPVDLLLDANIYSQILMDGILRGQQNAPIAQQTRMGWILCGNVKTYNCHAVLHNIDEIAQFWETEEIPNDDQTMTSEDEYCEQLFNTTTRRLTDGRYAVKIPMKQHFEQHLGTSKNQAIAQFLQMEKKICRNDSFSTNYKQFIHEYNTLGHMKRCKQKTEVECFLPHHGVLKLNSDTTKLRVVFNASAKTTSGFSLNDLMLSGPNLQQDLLTMILRWRNYRIVYTADIEKFYRQVRILEEDQSLQKIVWRSENNQSIQEYQLCTVTYGTKSAPYLAMRAVKQLINDDGAQFPLATEILEKQLYVDDLLGGSDSIEEAQEAQKQLINILKGGGFNLRQWASNDVTLLEQLPQQQISKRSLDFKHSQSNKTLGISWNPRTDNFTFQRPFQAELPTYRKDITKRSILSEMSKIYDPLGWLAPATLKAKILFQDIWGSKITWDQTLPQNIAIEWETIRSDIENVIEQIQIPRWVGTISKPTNNVQLHGFSDASEKAFGCVIYCKTKKTDGTYNIKLVAAKTKLAPLNKQISLPRLELCGALLLARLMMKVTESMTTTEYEMFGWTDSMVTLGWLQGEVTRWKAFVANRVSEIVQVIPAKNWNHTKSEDNPADLASRGLKLSQLVENELWWQGPKWLKTVTSPTNKQKFNPPEQERKQLKQNNAAQNISSNFIVDLLNKHSSMTRVTRIVAWVSRFVNNTRERTRAQFDELLTSTELETAERLIIMSVQEKHFGTEIMDLKKNGKVHCKSKILNLQPFLDTNGILRVGGRLRHSQLQNHQKHPIIVPNDDRITLMIIDESHKRTLHGGPRLTLAHIRDRYWVISGYQTVKRFTRRCIKCLRYNSTQNNQIMADLPEARVTPSRPFTHTGVDFSGYVEVKSNKGRGIKTTKGYIAVFICLATKAIHLELVSDLSSSTFISAFKRMCSRRGKPTNIYCDNGTNFVGAAKILDKHHQEAVQHYIDSTFADYIASERIHWHFNAPVWPSAGGLWEAAVKAMKFHLKRVIGEQKLTYEEFYTLLVQIEASLNSRPITTLTENIEDLDYLTPGHFLVGGPVLSSPTTTGPEITDIHRRWQLTEKMHKDFWKRWSADYLHSLQKRSKWNHTKENLQENDVVLIREDNAPPSKWLMGKVIRTHPGKDGRVRVVTLKTRNGELKRPIIRLAPLPGARETTTRTENVSTTRGKGKTSCFTVLLTSCLILFSLIASATTQAVNITLLEPGKAVYFDKIADMNILKDEWRMVAYYNMTTYWKSIENIEMYIEYVKKVCSKEHPSYQALALQFQHDLNEIKHNNNLLRNQHSKRRKRGLMNIVGNGAHFLFGVLDDQFATQYHQDINKIQENEKHLIQLYKKQTSVIEGEFNILKRNEEVMTQQFAIITKQLTEFEQRIRVNTETAVSVTASALAANIILANIHRVQSSLIDLVTDIHHGHTNTNILKPNQFEAQINIIAGHLPRDLALPYDNEKWSLKDLYKLLTVRARMINDLFIFEFKLPLVSVEQYEINKIIPIPQPRGESSLFISPTTDLVAVSLRTDTFTLLQYEDLQKCIQMNHHKFICTISQPIYSTKTANSFCEAHIINNGDLSKCNTRLSPPPCIDRWMKLHNSGAWLYSCCQECIVRIFCQDSTAITKKLYGTGLISISQGCLLRGSTFFIQTQNDFMNDLNITEDQTPLDIPSQINHMINVSRYIPIPQTHEQIFKGLEEKITEIKKKQEEFDPDLMSTHHIHHYTAIYVVFIIIGGAAITAAAWKIRNRMRSKATLVDAVTVEDRSLQLKQLSTAPNKVDRATSPTFTTLSTTF